MQWLNKYSDVFKECLSALFLLHEVFLSKFAHLSLCKTCIDFYSEKIYTEIAIIIEKRRLNV